MLGPVALVGESERDVEEADIAGTRVFDVAPKPILALDAVARGVATQRKKAGRAEAQRPDLARNPLDHEVAVSKLRIFDAAVAKLGLPACRQAIASERGPAVAGNRAVDVGQVRRREQT